MDNLLSVIIPSVFRESLKVAVASTNYAAISTIVLVDKEPESVMHKHASVTELRNKGVLLANTPWVTFLDDDDYWLPTHWDNLEPLLRTAPSETQMVITLPTSFPAMQDAYQLRKYIVHGEGLPASCITVRKDAALELGGFSAALVHSSHWALVAKALLVLGPEAVVINQAQTWVYVQNENGLAMQLAADRNINVIEDRRQWLTQFVS